MKTFFEFYLRVFIERHILFLTLGVTVWSDFHKFQAILRPAWSHMFSMSVSLPSTGRPKYVLLSKISTKQWTRSEIWSKCVFVKIWNIKKISNCAVWALQHGLDACRAKWYEIAHMMDHIPKWPFPKWPDIFIKKYVTKIIGQSRIIFCIIHKIFNQTFEIFIRCWKKIEKMVRLGLIV